MLTITIRIELAIGEPHQEVVVLVHDFFPTSARYINAVRIEKILWYQGQLCQNGRVPLYNMFLEFVVSREVVRVNTRSVTAH